MNYRVERRLYPNVADCAFDDDMPLAGFKLGPDDYAYWPHDEITTEPGRERIAALIQAYLDDPSPVDWNDEYLGLSEEEIFLPHEDGRLALTGRTISGCPYAVELTDENL